MKFRVIYRDLATTRKVRFVSSNRTPAARSAGSIVIWIASMSAAWLTRPLRVYAHNLLHFVRWWESIHHTGDVLERDSHRIDAAGVSALSIRPTTPAFRFHHQRTRRRRRSRLAQRVPRRPLPDRPRLSSSLFAPRSDGLGRPRGQSAGCA